MGLLQGLRFFESIAEILILSEDHALGPVHLERHHCDCDIRLRSHAATAQGFNWIFWLQLLKPSQRRRSATIFVNEPVLIAPVQSLSNSNAWRDLVF